MQTRLRRCVTNGNKGGNIFEFIVWRFRASAFISFSFRKKAEGAGGCTSYAKKEEGDVVHGGACKEIS